MISYILFFLSIRAWRRWPSVCHLRSGKRTWARTEVRALYRLSRISTTRGGCFPSGLGGSLNCLSPSWKVQYAGISFCIGLSLLSSLSPLSCLALSYHFRFISFCSALLCSMRCDMYCSVICHEIKRNRWMLFIKCVRKVMQFSGRWYRIYQFSWEYALRRYSRTYCSNQVHQSINHFLSLSLNLSISLSLTLSLTHSLSLSLFLSLLSIAFLCQVAYFCSQKKQ